jgi:exoribonuclease R
MKNRYKIHIQERNYSTFDLLDTLSLNKLNDNIDINPAKEKLFSNDLFEWDEENKLCNIIHSTVRVGGSYPAILVIDQNKTYGRYKKRLLYKCIPDDIRLPIFLVPYEVKQNFSKKCVNKYITFKYENWNGKHPQGSVTNVIGDVSKLDNFYEYQLFCKSLNDSIQNFTKATRASLKKKTEKQYIDYIKAKYPNIEDRTDQHIISIDPEGSKDFDDAIGLIDISGENNEEKSCILSIYIANVPIWMEVLNLWSSFSKRISTIYLPDRKRPMLPTILSDNLCSLQENQNRIAFCMDICIKNDQIENIQFSNAIINITRNYRYEDKDWEKNEIYKKSLKVVNLILENHKYLDSVKNSHDLVTYTMIFMNHECAKLNTTNRNS